MRGIDQLCACVCVCVFVKCALVTDWSIISSRMIVVVYSLGAPIKLVVIQKRQPGTFSKLLMWNMKQPPNGHVKLLSGKTEMHKNNRLIMKRFIYLLDVLQAKYEKKQRLFARAESHNIKITWCHSFHIDVFSSSLGRSFFRLISGIVFFLSDMLQTV